MKHTISACLSLALIISAPVFAQEKHVHNDVHHPKYGGIVTELNEVQYELVKKPDSIAIFVEDHGKKVSTQGATAKVTLLNGKEKTEVALVPAGENKLEAKGTFKVEKGTKTVAVVALAGKPARSVRFSNK